MNKLDNNVVIGKDHLREIVREEFDMSLTRMGFDIAAPVESQKDLQFVREWRQSTESVKRKGIATLATICITGICGIIWMGVKTIIKNP